MKIEIGESLMRSWLRHVKGCQFAELNWKPSGSWPQNYECQQFMDKARGYFQQSLEQNVFGGTKTSSQLVKQGEIDVLGVKLDGRGAVERLYGVDIAFHEAGLGYLDAKETTKRVIKKIIRSIIVVQSFFGPVPGKFVFASPKVGASFLAPLQTGIAQLKQFLMDEGLACEVTLLVNEAFREEVLVPTLARSAATADSSELFLRSYRLWRLFEMDKGGAVVPSNSNQNVLTVQANGIDLASGVLPIELEPASIQEFKNRLLNSRKARIIVYYNNDTSKENIWIASKFTSRSDPLGNLRSRPEFRQGEWQRRGISRVKVIVDDQASTLVG